MGKFKLPRFKNNLKTVSHKLVLINVIVYIIGLILLNNGYPFYEWFTLPDTSSENYKIYQWITYMFLHGSLLHILFNMIVLFSFGPVIENYLGKNKFIIFYILGGLFSAIIHYAFIDITDGRILGASGALFALLGYFTLSNPNSKVLLFLIIPMKTKYVITGILFYELIMVIIGVDDNVGHIAHLAGAFFGFCFYYVNKHLLNKKLIRRTL